MTDKINQRIEYIEHLLYWEGKLSRKDLTNYFNISIPQATKDIKFYIENATENIEYDFNAKHYIATKNFSPIFIKPDSQKYLESLLNDRLQIIDNKFEMGIVPSFYKLPHLKRTVNQEILRKLLRIMKDKKAVEIEYQSMDTPNLVKRSIAPHSLGYDGNRWHLRAYCYIDKLFKDFNLSRIHSILDEKISNINDKYDYLWHTNIIFKIAPHPEHSESAKRCIELDFGMENGVLNLEIKGAFIHYCKFQYKFDKEHQKRSPKEQQLILINSDEINAQESLLKNLTMKSLLQTSNSG